MSKEKYLIFANSTTDTMMFPVSNIAMLENTDADTMQIHFQPGTDNTAGSVIFEITADKGVEFMKLLTEAIRSSRSPYIVVADDINSEYFSGSFGGTTVAATACTTIALL
tara:strand:+ start:5808 stop:6137 length:330 start_codon:yes stop_codon:yes gene_type:complete